MNRGSVLSTFTWGHLEMTESGLGTVTLFLLIYVILKIQTRVLNEIAHIWLELNLKYFSNIYLIVSNLNLHILTSHWNVLSVIFKESDQKEFCPPPFLFHWVMHFFSSPTPVPLLLETEPYFVTLASLEFAGRPGFLSPMFASASWMIELKVCVITHTFFKNYF